MIKITKLYAVKEAFIGYSDIYASEESLLHEHPDAEVLEGYGILDTVTGHLTDWSHDIYWEKEDAIWDMETGIGVTPAT